MEYLRVMFFTLAELRFDPIFLYIPFICYCCIHFDLYLLRLAMYGKSKILYKQEKGKALRLLISTCGHYINGPEAQNISSCPTAYENLL